jgi:hypothetical protein
MGLSTERAHATAAARPPVAESILTTVSAESLATIPTLLFFSQKAVVHLFRKAKSSNRTGLMGLCSVGTNRPVRAALIVEDKKWSAIRKLCVGDDHLECETKCLKEMINNN